MMGVSGELYRAVTGLRKAAEAGLIGNSYYQTANRIADLIELIGPAAEGAVPNEDAAHDFASALAGARKAVESHLSGNRYYMAINKLEELACLSPAPPSPAQRAPSFDELAAASKARAAAAAASLGVVTAREAVPLHAQSPETLADGELERRSSEPCLMTELAPPALEPVAPAPIFPQATAPADLGKAAQSLGSPPASGEHSAVPGAAPVAAAAHPAAASALQASTPAYDTKAASAVQTLEAAGDPAPDQSPDEAAFYLGSPAASDAGLEEEAVRLDMATAEAGRAAAAPAAGQEIRVKKTDEIKPKESKTLFKLWLDLAFGRKD
jgi:hypothetical protein